MVNNKYLNNIIENFNPTELRENIENVEKLKNLNLDDENIKISCEITNKEGEKIVVYRNKTHEDYGKFGESLLIIEVLNELHRLSKNAKKIC